MSDLISRQDAIDAILGITPIQNTIPLDSAIFNIKKLPSAQKKGKWIRKPEFLWQGYECSLCGYEIASRTNYCQNCGADMRGKCEVNAK